MNKDMIKLICGVIIILVIALFLHELAVSTVIPILFQKMPPVFAFFLAISVIVLGIWGLFEDFSGLS